jgi:hypothetical protein
MVMINICEYIKYIDYRIETMRKGNEIHMNKLKGLVDSIYCDSIYAVQRSDLPNLILQNNAKIEELINVKFDLMEILKHQEETQQ